MQARALLSEKKSILQQLHTFSLFRRIRLAKGDRAFQEMAVNSSVVQARASYCPLSVPRNKFAFVLEGEVAIFKRDSFGPKCYLRSLKRGQLLRLQDYTIKWGEILEIQSIAKCRLLLLPLESLTVLMNGLYPLRDIEEKATFLQQLGAFAKIERAKLMAVSSFVTRMLVPANVEAKTGAFWIVICSGVLTTYTPIISQNSSFTTQTQCECLFLEESVLQKFKINLASKTPVTSTENKGPKRYKTENTSPERGNMSQMSFATSLHTIDYNQSKASQNQPQKLLKRPGTAGVSSSMEFRQTTLSISHSVREAASQSQMYLMKFLQRKGKLQSQDFHRYHELYEREDQAEGKVKMTTIRPFFAQSSSYIKQAKRSVKMASRNHVSQRKISQASRSNTQVSEEPNLALTSIRALTLPKSIGTTIG